MKTFYITTPIYYVNARPHIGNAYTAVAADVLARFKRMSGHSVLLATGTDEHGVKVATAAKESGRSPKDHVDLLVEDFKSLWNDLNISYDVFIRTTEERHRRATQYLFALLLQSGDIYKAEYQGWYCVQDETYLLASEVTDARCPNPECRRPVTWLTQPAYFFRTSRYAPILRELLQSEQGIVRPETRRNEVLGFIHQGLKDACISRTQIDWGIPVPGDEQNVIYVWFDALVNYLTVCGYPEENGFDSLWPPDVQLVGKDILQRFHATLWPAMLIAAGLPLPSCVFAHGFWTVEKKKISKSLGNVIYPSELADDLASASGALPAVCIDAIRYFLLREVPFGLDGDFSTKGLIGRFNSDLANDFGNLLNRTVPLLKRHCDGRIPSSSAEESVCDAILGQIDTSASALEELDFSNALIALWGGLAVLNKYLDRSAPWSASAASDREHTAKVLYTVLDGMRAVSTALLPFIPTAAGEVLDRLSLGSGPAPTWERARTFNRLPAHEPIISRPPLFPRFPTPRAGESATTTVLPGTTARIPEKDKQETRVTEEPKKITLDDFAKLDLRVGTVLEADMVPGTNRLVRLLVDIGSGTRTLVAGIGDVYPPASLVNKQLIVVTNLPATTIRGVTSEGMILAVGEKSVEALLTVDRPAAQGSKVR